MKEHPYSKAGRLRTFLENNKGKMGTILSIANASKMTPKEAGGYITTHYSYDELERVVAFDSSKNNKRMVSFAGYIYRENDKQDNGGDIKT